MSSPRTILLITAPRVADAHVAAVCAAVEPQGLKLAKISSLAKSPGVRDCAVLAFDGAPLHPEAMHPALLELSGKVEADLNWLSTEEFLREPKIACFDMDSTLIPHECIDELAGEAGEHVRAKVAEITEKAMQGNMDFATALRYRVKTLEGLPESVFDKINAKLRLMEGAPTLIATLKARGVHTVLVSGGFDVFARQVAKRLGIDEYHSNTLEVVDGKLTGGLVGRIVDGEFKKNALQAAADRLGVPLAQTLAVGDGANDLPMLGISGLGVAYHAKPKVKSAARCHIDKLPLDGILFLLGVHESHWITAP